MTVIQSHKQFSPAFKAGLSNDKETKNIIAQASFFGDNQDKLRAYALEKLLNKLDNDVKYALTRDESQTIFLKNAHSNEKAPLIDRPQTVGEIIKAPQKAVENLIKDIYVLLEKQMGESKLNELMRSIKSNFEKIDK